MKESANFTKIVAWSDEDQCFIGHSPGVIGPCCHGGNEKAVYAELCEIVDEWLAMWKMDGKPFPQPTDAQANNQTMANGA
ncbi:MULTISPECIES: hypothetical protein [Thiorhodovibrio]|uniref:hypothetical protein n=1 Tax=Thiorhodovibrio TaxID=61593 RepID=UPI001913BD67|nr:MULTISPECIES: hypothetical protein [Thiorhodovibrio]MBK5968361.1 hypothetical protein [Thiorhodovibrio winogradskyi]WPL13188.1 hypothetical protein Thiosp_02982 [Thiorhodovibrio litoralis]